MKPLLTLFFLLSSTAIADEDRATMWGCELRLPDKKLYNKVCADEEADALYQSERKFNNYYWKGSVYCMSSGDRCGF